MDVHLPPDLEAKLSALAAQTGRAPDELVQDAMAGYFAGLAQVRATLERRYDELKSGAVQLIDGEEARASLLAKNDEARRRGHA